MKKYLITLPVMIALLLPGGAFAEDHEEEMEFEEEEFETIEREVMSYIRSVEPRAVDVMEAWSEEEDGDEYIGTLIEIFESMEEIEELKEEAPQFAALYNRILASEIKMEFLGYAIQEAESDEERAALENELKTLLPRAFEDRMKEAEMEIAMLRKEIAEVEAEWKKRQANKEKIIQKRFQDLVGENEGLDW